MNYLIQRTLENRGYTVDFLREINNPNYDTLKDIDTLAVRLHEICDSQVPVTIFPDFDMDGICSGTTWFSGLSECGFKVNLFIPNPEGGYGVYPEAIDNLLAMYPDTKVIITCDTGIGAHDAADYCKELGIELIITDHHKQESIVDASIIVNPMRLDEEYSHPAICGTFVSYQVLQRYADLYCNTFTQDQIRRLRVFAGIGTVSDTMPLLYENRQLVRDAIFITRMVYGDGTVSSVNSIPGCDVYRRAFFGLYQAVKVCEEFGVVKSVDDIDEDFFGFYLAPIFNSTKRMDGDMSRTFGVFFANTSHDDMSYLYNLNIERKNLVEAEMKAMLSSNQPYAPYIYFTNASSGILGLLAMKAYGMSGVPTFVLKDYGVDNDGARYHGSGRSPEWYPCIKRLSCVAKIEGHEFAFGCGVKDESSLLKFYEFLKQDVTVAYNSVEFVESVPDFVISTDWTADVGIDIEMFKGYLYELHTLKPFGKGFPAPIVKFKFKNNDVIAWKLIGSAKQHLKIMFHNGFDVLCWNQGYLIKQKDSFDEHVVMGHLGTSEYMGMVSVNFVGDLIEQ